MIVVNTVGHWLTGPGSVLYFILVSEMAYTTAGVSQCLRALYSIHRDEMEEGFGKKYNGKRNYAMSTPAEPYHELPAQIFKVVLEDGTILFTNSTLEKKGNIRF